MPTMPANPYSNPTATNPYAFAPTMPGGMDPNAYPGNPSTPYYNPPPTGVDPLAGLTQPATYPWGASSGFGGSAYAPTSGMMPQNFLAPNQPDPLESGTANQMLTMLNTTLGSQGYPPFAASQTLNPVAFGTAMQSFTSGAPMQPNPNFPMSLGSSIGQALDPNRVMMSTPGAWSSSGYPLAATSAMPYNPADVAPIGLQSMMATPGFQSMVNTAVQHGLRYVGVGVVVRPQSGQMGFGGVNAPVVMVFGNTP
jgi:hypothetical protein